VEPQLLADLFRQRRPRPERRRRTCHRHTGSCLGAICVCLEELEAKRSLGSRWASMRFWWVNHKQTFAEEVGGHYIWCPKHKKDGARNHFYETLREVQRGDLVFSFADAHLQAVGAAKLPCYSCPRPDEFGKVGEAWDQRGWRVDVQFQRFQRPLRVASVAD